MARGGLYKSDVQKARRSLLAQGKHPSVDALRVALGNTGSKTTIHRYLRELEAEEGAGVGAQVAVSDALQDLVARLAARLHEEAEAQIATVREETGVQIKASHEALELANQQAAAFSAQLQRTERGAPPRKGSERGADNLGQRDILRPSFVFPLSSLPNTMLL